MFNDEDGLTLFPFIEPEDPDIDEDSRFVAGFRTKDGER